MNTTLVTLSLVYRDLGVPVEASTLDFRVAMQKAAYIAQRCGVDLGYSFSWYERGPYSRALAEDYCELLNESQDDLEGFRFGPAAGEALERAKELVTRPSNVECSDLDWIELVASWSYLTEARGLSEIEALRLLEEEKPNLARYSEEARSALASTV